MKLNKVLFGLTVVAAALFSSCNKDNEGAIYSNQGNAGVSFTASTLATVEVPASNPVFDVEIVRGNTVGAATGNLTATLKSGDEVIPGATVSAFNFADGQNSTTVSVNIAPLAVGVAGTITLTIDDADASIGGVKTATMKVSKAYEWKLLGVGEFADNWLGYSSDVEIYKAEGFDRYRVIAPYAEYVTSEQAVADWGADWLAPTTSVNQLDIWIEDGLAFYENFPLGINYDGDKAQPIYGCHPSGWSSMQDPSFWAHNMMGDGYIQLAPYYYIDGLGGWNNTQYDGVIVITLP